MIAKKKPLVEIPRDPDATVTLMSGFDFREPGHSVVNKVFEGAALKKLWDNL